MVMTPLIPDGLLRWAVRLAALQARDFAVAKAEGGRRRRAGDADFGVVLAGRWDLTEVRVAPGGGLAGDLAE
jgi:hypothetical protein